MDNIVPTMIELLKGIDYYNRMEVFEDVRRLCAESSYADFITNYDPVSDKYFYSLSYIDNNGKTKQLKDFV